MPDTIEEASLTKIDPRQLAFDIDGVVADIMSTFIAVAKEHYNIHHIRGHASMNTAEIFFRIPEASLLFLKSPGL